MSYQVWQIALLVKLLNEWHDSQGVQVTPEQGDCIGHNLVLTSDDVAPV